MTAQRPDFSPAMLRAFLHARADLAVRQARHEGRSARSAVRAFKRELRKAARVSSLELSWATDGHLKDPAPRTRLWGALGHVPADAGVLLTHGGQEPC